MQTEAATALCSGGCGIALKMPRNEESLPLCAMAVATNEREDSDANTTIERNAATAGNWGANAMNAKNLMYGSIHGANGVACLPFL